MYITLSITTSCKRSRTYSIPRLQKSSGFSQKISSNEAFSSTSVLNETLRGGNPLVANRENTVVVAVFTVMRLNDFLVHIGDIRESIVVQCSKRISRCHQVSSLKAVLKRDFPLYHRLIKRLSILRSHFLTKMLEIFRNYYSKYEKSNAGFHFCLNLLQ